MAQDQDVNGQVWPPGTEPISSVPLTEILTGDPADVSIQNLTVHKCAACDGKHEAIQMREFTRPPHPFTHFYLCPTLGDPVPVALAMMHAGTAMELRGPVCQGLAAAQVCGRFMAVIFWHDDENKLRMYFHEEKFPMGDYFETADQKGVMGMLKQQLEANAGTLQQQAMRRAQTPKPLRDLLGSAAPSNKEQFKIPPEVASAFQPPQQ